MAHKNLLPESVSAYANQTITVETDIQKRLRAQTRTLPEGGMQISPDQGAFLSLLVSAIGARRVVEVGTFTGYSALTLASALPRDGKLIACDVSDEWTRVGKPYWDEAGVADRIELRLGPANETLQTLLNTGHAGTIDLVFIDADKESYDIYYEHALKLLRVNGVIVLDNMLRGGAVVDPSPADLGTAAIRTLSLKIRDDSRVQCSLLTVGDGFMLVRKR